MPLAHFGPLVATGVCIDPSARALIGHHVDAKNAKRRILPDGHCAVAIQDLSGVHLFCLWGQQVFVSTRGGRFWVLHRSIFPSKKNHLKIVDFRVGSKKSSEKIQNKCGPTFLQIFQDFP